MVVGQGFPSGNKQLVSIDFTHPLVKAAFSYEYECEYDPPVQPEIYKQIRRFKAMRNNVIKEVKSKSEFYG